MIAQQATQQAVSVVFWVLVLIAVLIPLAVATVWLRRWIRKDDDQTLAGGFTLPQIRELLRQGKLTQAEYDRLRQEIVAQTRHGPVPPDHPAGP